MACKCRRLAKYNFGGYACASVSMLVGIADDHGLYSTISPAFRAAFVVLSLQSVALHHYNNKMTMLMRMVPRTNDYTAHYGNAYCHDRCCDSVSGASGPNAH